MPYDCRFAPDKERIIAMPINDLPQNSISNPWTDRAVLPKMPAKHIVGALIAILASAVGLAFPSHEAISWTVMGVLFLYVALFVRIPSTVTMTLITPMLVIFSVGESYIAAAVLSLTVGISACTLLLTAFRHGWAVALIPCAVGVAGILIHGDLLFSLLALALLPSAALIATATVQGRGKTSVLCFGVGGLLAVVAGAVIYLLWQGSRTAGVEIGVYVQSIRESVVEFAVMVRDELIRLMEESGGTEMQLESLKQGLTDTYLSAFIAEIFSLLPGILIAICCVIVYEAHSVLNATYAICGWKSVLKPHTQILTMSVVSAILYVAAAFVYLLIPESGIAVAVAGNVCVMLLPGFVAVGARAILMTAVKMKRGRGLLIVFVLAMLCCSFASALYMLALWGASGTVMEAARRKMMQKWNGEDGSTPPNDPEE